ncbi:MAG: RidA family protein [Phycisphaerales bacterium]|nr:MAG: RidA family protein [Phycisphaerales bacterium]
MRKQVIAEKGAQPQGIYSPAIVASGTIAYISGQGPVDPQSGQLQLGSFAEQAKLTFDNVTTLLEAAGTSWEHVVKVGVFLADLKDFGEMNDIYRTYLTEPYPARTTVQAGLPTGMLIEVDCMAIVAQES